MNFTFDDFVARTVIDQVFKDKGQESQILAAMRTIYNSPTAKKMIDDWFICHADTEKINFKFDNGPDGPWADLGMKGIIHFDLAWSDTAMYIDDNGTAVQDTLVTMMTHELVHALTGRLDNPDLIVATNDYRQATVTYSNIIYRELGLPEQNSYIGQNIDHNLILRFQYTNGAAIDRSVSQDADWDSSGAGNSNDLLIGGISGNVLSAGDGNDFLYGNGGNDTLDGGAGNDVLIGGVDDDTLIGGTGKPQGQVLH